MSNWIVYLLKCGDNSIYCGTTNNIEKRLKAHIAGKGAKYTKGRLPLTLIAKTEPMGRGEALSFEARVKKARTGEKKLELVRERSA